MPRSWILGFVALALVVTLSTTAIYGMVLDKEEQYFSPMSERAISFIATNHPEAANFVNGLDLTYLGGGAFSGDGWYIEIESVGQACTVHADFSVCRTNGSTGIPYRIVWSGTIMNGTVEETSYSIAV